MSLKLSVSDLSLTLTKFIDAKYPRAIIEPFPSIEYSIFGATIGTGVYYPSKYIWTINAIVDQEQARMLGAIYQEWDSLRRALSTTAHILLQDTILEIQERTPRTRPLVPDTSEILIGSSQISYFAQFNTWMTKPPEFDYAGIHKFAHFTLIESD